MACTLQEIENTCGSSIINEDDQVKHILSLSRFIQSAPSDFVEALISSQFGMVFKLFLNRCCGNISENKQIVDEKNTLSQELRILGVRYRSVSHPCSRMILVHIQMCC